ncbi:uncharacterized protein LOC122533062 [Frieseomelitta varia]|uniref:uncharacterized protein LOC122533062 n=1 Tax=Frieseomelitta varia TaxID=561572 RepID=UPI001CB6ADED|nr:uncharacterized protein LOC122533062 [Frieseomelitta varia]XP_043518355.1 uncharacterized protein LOC122533062 [Frieseomelitta varia]
MSMRPGLGPKLFLVLVTTTIVIGNYQRHRERTHLREQLVNGHKITRNVTRLQDLSMSANLLVTSEFQLIPILTGPGVGTNEGRKEIALRAFDPFPFRRIRPPMTDRPQLTGPDVIKIDDDRFETKDRYLG